MITLSPHPYVPPGAMMLALALLFGVTILNNNKLSKKISPSFWSTFQPVRGPGFEAIWAKCQWLLRASPKKKSPPAGPANHGGGEVVQWPSATVQSFEMLGNALEVGARKLSPPNRISCVDLLVGL